MIKKKNINIILIFLVLFLWGTVAYKSLHKFFFSDNNVESPNTFNNKITFSQINKDTFNLYLNETYKIGLTSYPMVTDVHDIFNIKIVTKKNKHLFEGKYPNTYKQPWYELSNKSTTILNLAINAALVSLLPKQFLRLSSIDFQTLTTDYIEWYLKRQKNNYINLTRLALTAYKSQF